MDGLFMGAWDELDTQISVNVDTSDIHNASSRLDDFFTAEIAEYLEDLEEAVEEGSRQGISDLAGRNRSFQQQIINDVCDNPSGMLASSIQEEEQDEYTYLIGTIINEIYPMSIEYGRGPVYPIRARALAFYAPTGELVFRMSAGPSKPRPFVAPAFDRTLDIAENIMLEYVGGAVDKC